MANIKDSSVNDIHFFWEQNPLFQGESDFKPGTPQFFEEHKKVYINDCFAGILDRRVFPESDKKLVLDLGCGPGFWTIEILKNNPINRLISLDLTNNALRLTQKRLKIYKVSSELVQANAEVLPFASDSIDHINCQGVIHHTPDTEKCISEIFRILKPGGKALISVYYHNLFLRNWPKLKWIGLLLFQIGAKMPGRGREKIFSYVDVDEIVRLYDGIDNPLGKAYSRDDFITMIRPYFEIEDLFFHFFPARSLPVTIPKFVHRWLDRNIPFMIFARVCKPLRY